MAPFESLALMVSPIRHEKCSQMNTNTITGPFVFVTLEQMDELNSLPDSVVDELSIHRENLAVKYTKAVEPDPILLHSLRADLSPKLGS